MSELSGPLLGQAEDEEGEGDGTFLHPPEGEQSAESDETLSPDE